MRKFLVVGTVQLVFLMATLGVGVLVSNSLDNWICSNGCSQPGTANK